MKTHIVFVAVVVACVFGSVGCKSQTEKVCDHLVNTVKVDEGKYTTEACTKDFEQLADDCQNFEELLDCALEAKTEEDAGKCFFRCEPSEEEKK